MICPICGTKCVWEIDYDRETGTTSEGWYCHKCGLPFDSDRDPPEPPEPDLAAKSFRETYIEAWHQHQRLHRR